MSNNQEIKELQNKFLEFIKLYNDLKNELKVTNQDIYNQITRLKEDVFYYHEDAHSKDNIILNVNMFLSEFKGMNINQRLSSLFIKYDLLNTKIEENRTQTKLNQRTMTLIYIASTFAIGICAIAVPVFFKLLVKMR